MTDLTSIVLNKWPGLLVKGNPVTIDQADEILLRTNSWNLCTNNHAYVNQVAKALGFYCDREPSYKNEELINYEKKREFLESIQVLNLNYLATERIVSCWIGGPHGWCNYNGAIFNNNSNIGKWPTAEEVFQEWQTIATAFPYLNLTCQLLSHEICTDDADVVPVIEYRVSKGNVTYQTDNLNLIELRDTESALIIFKSGGKGEIGISVEDLVTKVNTLKARLI